YPTDKAAPRNPTVYHQYRPHIFHPEIRRRSPSLPLSAPAPQFSEAAPGGRNLPAPAAAPVPHEIHNGNPQKSPDRPCSPRCTRSPVLHCRTAPVPLRKGRLPAARTTSNGSRALHPDKFPAATEVRL